MAEIMFETFNVPALYMKPQPYLSMFSYGATSGVIVDIGDRIDVVPLDQGYVFEKGISQLKQGGKTITERMQRGMTAQGHRFFSAPEAYIARLVKERACFVAPDFDKAMQTLAQGRIQQEVGTACLTEHALRCRVLLCMIVLLPVGLALSLGVYERLSVCASLLPVARGYV